MVDTNNDEQIRLLNADIRGEHDAIVHYLTHAWTVAEVYGPRIESIARDEMRHLKWLAHTVVSLQGVPDLTPRHAEPVTVLKEALVIDIAAENEAIAQYADHRERIDDPRIQALLARIIVDEKDHRRQFQEMAEQTEGTAPDFEAGPNVAVAEVAQHLQTLLGFEYQQILNYLFQYFVAVHGPSLGMNDEDRAVEEMKHLGWIAEALTPMGQYPDWRKASGHRVSPDSPQKPVYQHVLAWAEQESPDFAPLMRRILAHQEYQWQNADASGWTVGPLKDAGKKA